MVGRPDSPTAGAAVQAAEGVRKALERERRCREREADPTVRAAHEEFWEQLLEE